MYAQVIFPMSRFQAFDYQVPDFLAGEIGAGSCVQAPVGNSSRIGFVVAVSQKTAFEGHIRPIEKIFDRELNLPSELWRTLEWTARYYLAPMGKVLRAAIPYSFQKPYQPPTEYLVSVTDAGMQQQPENIPERYYAQRAVLEMLRFTETAVPVTQLKPLCKNPLQVVRRLENKGWVRLDEIQRPPDPFNDIEIEKPRNIKLNDEQVQVYEELVADLESGRFKPCLMKGVTGSGKTEVYLKLTQYTVDQGGSALILVPEIALTPQVASRFRGLFGNSVALWHSRMTNAEKGWTWQQLKRGRYKVLVGARSGVFAPLQNLGLIVMDEEQETTYKQEGSVPRYHARDVALMRGKYAAATVILTSATPSLESHYNSIMGRLKRLELTKRYGTAVYPKVTLVDMRHEPRLRAHQPTVFSRCLHEEIQGCIDRREQVILLQNRRGFAPILRCCSCGKIVECPHCAVALTYHRSGNQMVCHYCDYTCSLPENCSECGEKDLELSGAGTQKVEDEIIRIFPGVHVERMDLDTVRKRGEHYHILERFRQRKTDILLGTQMVAKGLDFENVTLVGVISADAGLFLPDFRAGERIFQLIYQVAGRAGRHLKPGRAVIQTYNPDDPIIKAAAALDIQKFTQIALSQRNELFYPPFSRLVRILFSGPDRQKTMDLARNLSKKFRQDSVITTLGPAPAPLEKLRNKYRCHIIIKVPREQPLQFQKQFYQEMVGRYMERMTDGISVQVDVDPVSTL